MSVTWQARFCKADEAWCYASAENSTQCDTQVLKRGRHRVTKEGLKPDPGILEALLNMPMPKNMSQPRSVPGAVGHCHTRNSSRKFP